MSEVKTEKLANIKPDLTNANRHTERGNAMLRASMDEFGFAEAGTLDANNRIIGGNHRTEVAADVLASDEVLVIEVDGTKPVYIKRSDIDLNTEQGRRLAYALNRTAQVSIEFDPEQVLADIGEGVSLDGLFHQNDIDELLAEIAPPMQGEDTEPEISRADELRQEWRTELGQLWALADHRLICGDCTDEATVKRVMDGELAVITFTSPPYSDMRDYGGNDLSIETLLPFLSISGEISKNIIVNLGLQTKDNCIVPYWDKYIEYADGIGLKFLSWSVWDRGEAGTIAHNTSYLPIEHEWIFVWGSQKLDIKRTAPISDATRQRRKHHKRDKDGKRVVAVRQSNGTFIETTTKEYGNKKLEQLRESHHIRREKA